MLGRLLWYTCFNLRLLMFSLTVRHPNNVHTGRNRGFGHATGQSNFRQGRALNLNQVLVCRYKTLDQVFEPQTRTNKNRREREGC